MILTNDKTIPKKKKQPAQTIIGERTKAKEFFNSIPLAGRTPLLNATVYLSTTAGNKGSGVILAADTTTAYVLTAKHLLYTLSGLKSPDTKKPSDFNNTTFLEKVQIGYTTAALEGAPTLTAPVTGLNFTGSDDQTWQYDIMIMESTDATFRTFVLANRFVRLAMKQTYDILLSVKRTGCEALNTKNYKFIQLGFGDGRDPEVIATKSATDYTDFAGKVQCKQSQPKAATPLDGFFEIVDGKPSAQWPVSDQICEMVADVTNSSGPGDSGGPLFALLKTDLTKFFLVGLTTGANVFSDPELKKPNATIDKKLYGDDDIHNNVVTFWKNVYLAWPWD
jgi:hypothetical protein